MKVNYSDVQEDYQRLNSKISCLESELEAKDKEIKEAHRKGFWMGYEDSRCFPHEHNILHRYTESTKGQTQ